MITCTFLDHRASQPRTPAKSGRIWPDLDKSEHLLRKFSAHSAKFAPIAENFPAKGEP